MKSIFESKKGQIGDTITWVPAFLIISFFAVIYIVVVLILIGGRTLSPTNLIFGGNSFDENNLDYGSHNELNVLLSREFLFNGQQKSLRNLLLEWAISEDKSEIEDFLEIELKNYLIEKESFTGKCYIFNTYVGDKINYFAEFNDRQNNFFVSSREINPESAFGRLQRGVYEKIVGDDFVLNVNYYGGSC